ncbi:M48 family metallopeptidase, partial [uncultured Campylobacter sp.]|uniref:M48 family metallopeptidase n=1 Tax=uncultured Campylobacter sp. TaxID=218934 RepID=UPI0028E85904
MFYFLLGIYFFYVAAKAWLAILQIGFIRAEAKKPAVVLEQGEYKTAAAAAISNQKFELISLLYHAAIFMMWACWGLGAISGHAYKTGDIGDNVFMVMVFLLVSSLLELPLNIYETFVKDKRLGFSNVTPKIFALDLLKTLALTLVFGTLFVWLVLLCIRFLGDFWWFWAFLLSFAIALVINLIYPTLIAPIFNKMQPLEEGELKSRIEGLLAQCGFKSSGVFTIDASKRDNRLNAYFGGLGATKRVVLFDTLVKKLSLEEIIAVLGHEL